MLHHLKYLKYLLIHKWYVFLECCKLGIVWRGIIHDLSKFCPDEWIPYCKYFYKGKKNKEEFDNAWIKHYLRNKHHWNHWINLTKPPKEMPYKYVLEMLADWNAMGKIFNNTSLSYYIRNKNKILLHPNTRYYLEYLLGLKK